MNIDQALLDRYLNGTCTAEEKILVAAWLSNPPYPKEQQALADTWTVIQQEIATHTALTNGSVTGQKSPEAPARQLPLRWIAVAASLLLALSVGLYTVHQLKTKASVVSAEEMVTIVTQAGSRKVVTLGDGTVVTLNSLSTLRYPKHFTAGSREVSLSGEAYFEVARDTKKPFQITTRHSHTKVLGTVFNLKDYEGEKQSTLTLTKGRVEFTATKTGRKCIVTPNLQAIAQAGGELSQHHVYPGAYNGWKESRLVFNGHSLKEMLPVMERWYGIKIVLADAELGNKHCSGSYENPSLNELMKSLSFILQFHYERNENDNSIVIRRGS